METKQIEIILEGKLGNPADTDRLLAIIPAKHLNVAQECHDLSGDEFMVGADGVLYLSTEKVKELSMFMKPQ